MAATNNHVTITFSDYLRPGLSGNNATYLPLIQRHG
jgi:hypothetical protein